MSKLRITRLARYVLEVPHLCPYCLQRQCMGETDYSRLGCAKCQAEVDRYVESYFEVIDENPMCVA